ncbi:MAG: ABC transporter ATP-binding protein [Planctomycetes bacterium]|nr:ABC transporter ATP-binding protein [Planctomycetota bacterium]
MTRNRKTSTIRTLARFYGFVGPYWPLMVGFVIAAVVCGGANAAKLYVLKPLIDETMQKGSEDALWWIGKFIAIIAPTIAVSGFFEMYCSRRLLASVIVSIRDRICQALLPQSISFFEDRRSGDLMSRLTNDVGLTQRLLVFIIGDIIREPIKIIALVTLAVYSCWWLSCLFLLIIPLLGVPLAFFGRKIRRYSRKSLERLADLTDAMQQMFSGIRIVKAFKMEDAEEAEFRTINARYLNRAVRLARAKSLVESSIEFICNIGMAVALVTAGVILLRGWADAGSLTVFLGALASLYRPIKRLSKSYNNLQEALPAVERIVALIDEVPSIQDQADAVDMPEFKNEIRFNNVTFAYGTEPVLKNIRLTVKKGEVVAIVGHSGAGKSTLCDLVARFYEPQQGTIEIDGVDLRRIKRDSLLDHIAMVAQETFLFNRSIKDNIRYGRRDATNEEVRRAAEAANIREFIESQPEGYDTVVGEMGGKLSGGQRQRIAIARAILKNADILILDEATSSLDSESEHLVQEALKNLMQRRTTFVIAHRLSTVQHADRIVVLRRGEIVQVGSHKELMAQDGVYRHLYDMQFAGS